MAEKFSGILIAGFLVNLIIPGLGTIILEKYELGIIQVLLTISISLILFTYKSAASILTITAILLIAVWIWAFITGIRALKEK